MTVPVNEIYTGIKFFGQKIFLESSGEKETDAALKSVFWDSYHRTAPLRMMRRDVSLLVGRLYEGQVTEHSQGQKELFE